MKIVTLCGSIRKNSSNHSLLKAIRSFFPSQTDWVDFDIQTLPYFDPQMQFGDDLPKVAKGLRDEVRLADFIMIATPEYAHGIPGILKNALEWLICEESMKKKVLLFIGTSSGGEYVKQYLLETLKTMDLVASAEMTFTILGGRGRISPLGEILDQDLKNELSRFIQPFLTEVRD